MTSSPVTHLASIPFEHDIRRLTDDSTGRDWIFHKVDEWLKNKRDRPLNGTFRPEDRVSREFEPLQPYNMEKQSEQKKANVRQYY